MNDPAAEITVRTLLAPAKLNLGLQVLGQRSDGYHEIVTLFERLDWGDQVTAERCDAGLSLEVSGRWSVPATDDNLVLRAAQRLHEQSGTSWGARLRLNKRIPVAAGLGGGSSDAAATLLALNAIWALEWSQSDLQRLGRELGADVPFFLQPEVRAVARGRGDVLEPLSEHQELWYVVATPDEHLLTADVYAKWCAPNDLTAAEQDVNLWLSACTRQSPQESTQPLVNDLESVATQLAPIIQVIKHVLHSGGAHPVLMTGSGPSVFGVVSDESSATALANQIRTDHPAWAVVATCTNRHRTAPPLVQVVE